VKAISLTWGDLTLAGQKSAEAILAGYTSEGLNMKREINLLSSRNLSRRQKLIPKESTLKRKQYSCGLIRESRVGMRHKPEVNSIKNSITI